MTELTGPFTISIVSDYQQKGIIIVDFRDPVYITFFIYVIFTNLPICSCIVKSCMRQVSRCPGETRLQSLFLRDLATTKYHISSRTPIQ